MSLLFYKIIAALLIFLTSLASVIYPIRVRALPTHHGLLELGDAFASGIFLGVALFHMLPSAIASFSLLYANSHYPIAELFCAVGFLLLLFFERLTENRTKCDEGHSHANVSYVIAIIIIIHSLVEGAALGINTTLAEASIIFVAIIAHKSSESFALAIILNKANIKMSHVILLVTTFALMTPAGIAMGTSLTLSLQNEKGQFIQAAFNAFAAGTFLYMSTLHHINHHQRSHYNEGLFEFFALSAGLAVMAAIAFWA